MRPIKLDRSSTHDGKPKTRVLIIEDSAFMRMLIRQVLKRAGYEVVAEAATGKDGIEKAIKHQPDLVTLDNVLPDMFGLDILKTIKNYKVDIDVIMISADSQNSLIKEEKSLGASDYVIKPFTGESLLDVVEKVTAPKLNYAS